MFGRLISDDRSVGGTLQEMVGSAHPTKYTRLGLRGGFEVDDEEENSLNEDGRVRGVSVQTGSGGSGTGFGRFARHG